MTEGFRDESGVPAPFAPRTVLCVYCREPIASDAFTYWSSARRLVTTVCPACERRVTLPAATWRRLSRESRSVVEITDDVRVHADPAVAGMFDG